MHTGLGSRVAVQDHPVPEVGDDDILVGIAGQNVSARKVGDHVAGFVTGSTFADSGAYAAEYTSGTPAELAWAVPKDTFTHEQAATLGCAFWTAAQALYHPKRLGLVEPPAKVSGDREERVYTSVGQFAIQPLAALAGYKVVATASPNNFELVKGLGASAVFDYRDPDVVPKVKAAAHDSVRAALDTISLKDSQGDQCGGHGADRREGDAILPVIPDATARADVPCLFTPRWAAYTFAATGHHVPAIPEDRAQIVEFLKKVPGPCLSIKLWEGGLGSVPAELQHVKEGKVSAEKIVHMI
ncbi:GroES-like protein [Ganoderma leucocontextum]|nr:GroES-like protein [Ganoderma leucocontextum]